MQTKESKQEKPMLFNGRRVRSWCVDAGLTYDQLAEAIGKNTGTVKSWIYNQRRIDFDDACLIAEFFNKPLDDLRLDLEAA